MNVCDSVNKRGLLWGVSGSPVQWHEPSSLSQDVGNQLFKFPNREGKVGSGLGSKGRENQLLTYLGNSNFFLFSDVSK